MISEQPARIAARGFQFPGGPHVVRPYGGGLIHSTYLVSSHVRGERFLLQRLNTNVFSDIAGLMQNVERVLDHLGTKLAELGHVRMPSLVRTHKAETWLEDGTGAWRAFTYVEGTYAVDAIPNLSEAFQIGRAFGLFLGSLTDFPHETLVDVLTGYRDTERYLASLKDAVECDRLHREKHVRAEIAFLEDRSDAALCLQRLFRSGRIPARTIHGDTKSDNVLLDTDTGKAVCVVDWDTVTSGSLLHDLGDCVREVWAESTSSHGSASAQDLAILQSLLEGFLQSLPIRLSGLEQDNIYAAVLSITLELAIRFLTDHLVGDRYFRIARAGENLDRARRHIQLAALLEAERGRFEETVHRCVQST